MPIDGGTRRGVLLSRLELAILRKNADLFPIGSVEREEAVQCVMEIIRTSKSRRHKIAAVRTLAVLQSVNLKELELSLKAGGSDQSEIILNVTNNTQVNTTAAIVQQALNDPAYLEYLESRSLAEDRDASSIRPDSGPELANGPPLANHQSSPGAGI